MYMREFIYELKEFTKLIIILKHLPKFDIVWQGGSVLELNIIVELRR